MTAGWWTTQVEAGKEVGELGDDAYGIYNFNWGYYLESLRLLCEEGVGKPFQVAPG